MFKQITAIILLLALSLQVLNRVVIYLDYYNNVASYAKNCENKALPTLQCNGKCQMAKKILEEQKKDEQTPERKLENKTHLVCSQSYYASVSLRNNPVDGCHCGSLVEQEAVVYLSPIFHPPCLV